MYVSPPQSIFKDYLLPVLFYDSAVNVRVAMFEIRAYHLGWHPSKPVFASEVLQV
jgi:hypothetical protein